jgi:SAM-dependent methyltransferase
LRVTKSTLCSGLRLNLGCGTRTPDQWTNVDYSLGARLGKIPPLRPLLRSVGIFHIEWSASIFIHDLRRPLPWPDGSVTAIYSSHTLEHLTKDAGQRLLCECRRVLSPGGVIRIAVPNLPAMLEEYHKGVYPAVDLFERLGVTCERQGDGRLRRWLAPLIRFPHRCMYDAESLLAALSNAGFDARLHAPLLSRVPDIADVECEERVRGGVIAEARVPD